MEKRKNKGQNDTYFQFRFLNKSGQYVWMKQFTHPIQFKGEYALLTILVDIDFLKQMELKLIKNEKFLDLIFNNLTHAIAVLDPMDLHLITANKEFLRFNNVTEEEIKGKPCFEIIHRKGSPCYLHGESCPAKDAINQKKTISLEHIHNQNETNPQYFEIIVVPVLNNDDNIVIQYNDNDVLNGKRRSLQRTWSEASYQIQASDLQEKNSSSTHTLRCIQERLWNSIHSRIQN